MSKITRTQIISSLKELEKDSKVYAYWLEGADAHGRVDKYSDIDIWIDVSDNYVSKAFVKIEKILSKLGKIDYSFEKEHNHPKIRQKFYHLKGTSEFLVIDICIQKHSRVFWYTYGYKDEKVKIIFDKSNVVNYKKLNKSKFDKEIKQKILKLDKSFIFFQMWVKKEANRKHFLQSFAAYQKYVLMPLVELIRLKYIPTKSGYNLAGISGDNIPQPIIKQLEDLYKISSIEDIKKKMKIANKLYQKVRTSPSFA